MRVDMGEEMGYYLQQSFMKKPKNYSLFRLFLWLGYETDYTLSIEGFDFFLK
jgi:hypothetical protein